MKHTRQFSLIAAAATLMLAACGDQRGAPPPEEEEGGDKRSIFRPEFQVEPIEALEPRGALETRIAFPEGAELTEEARADLATVLASPQMGEGGTVTLRGHSDSGGDDEANLRASQARADAVAEWLIENGVAQERIVVIAFGEQNPVAPNALPDGTPNEAGRATNRRVEIEVSVPVQPTATKEPTLAESIASSAEESRTQSSDRAQ